MTKSFSFSAIGLFALTISASAQVTSDNFSAAELSKNWAAAKGTWTIKDGKLHGAELASDKHPAVLTYKAPHTDSKVKVSFQLAGSKGFGLSFNHPTGHLFRVNVSATGAQLVIDKDKKNPDSKAELLAKKEVTFEQGKTYTVTCETSGDTSTVEFDNGVKLEGKHPALAKEKTGYRLVIAGEGVIFDDFEILSSK